tara:strand:- start:417 stop:620 length:204 start_codon:yes stop_codon:yes gene_type:complete
VTHEFFSGKSYGLDAVYHSKHLRGKSLLNRCANTAESDFDLGLFRSKRRWLRRRLPGFRSLGLALLV